MGWMPGKALLQSEKHSQPALIWYRLSECNGNIPHMTLRPRLGVGMSWRPRHVSGCVGLGVHSGEGRSWSVKYGIVAVVCWGWQIRILPVRDPEKERQSGMMVPQFKCSTPMLHTVAVAMP